jgi:hypothetical protein
LKSDEEKFLVKKKWKYSLKKTNFKG